MDRTRMMSMIAGFILAFVLLAFGVLSPLAHADEWNQGTKVTFSQSVQVPGRILPSGTYWFELAESGTNRNIVQIYGADRITLYATILTGSSERLETTDETAFTLADRPSDEPPAVLEWFYPGDLIGHAFLYSRRESKELAQDKQEKILAPETHANGL
jgi:hypothetical protein